MRPGLPWKDAFRRPVQVCAAAPGLLAYLALLCWVLGDGRITALGRGYTPMYVLTASLMILLCCGVLFHWCWPSQPVARGFALFFVAVVEFMSLLVLSQSLWAFDLPLLRSLTLAGAGEGDIPGGPMSPLSAAAFLCAGLALACELRPWGRRWWCRQTAAALAVATWSMSFMVLVLYAAGTPLLYGGRGVPMSVLTAVSFAMLSFAVLLAAGPDTLPLSLFRTAANVASGPSRYRFLGAPLLTFAFLAGGIGIVGYAYFRHQVAAVRETAQLTMSAVADLKMRQILKWRQERLGNARMIMEELHLRRDLQEFLAAPRRSAARSDLLEWLQAVREHNEGLRILLLDPQMNVRLACPEDRTYFGPTAQSYALLALRTDQVVLSDLHRSRFSGEIHLDLAIPVRPGRTPPRAGAAPAGHGRCPPLGVIIIEVDPEKFLYPQIQNWPTPSPTAETLLARREGDQVVFLNELRHRKGTALSLRLPRNHPLNQCMIAAGGRERMMEGIDYRGKPVLASTRVIPGTPWFVVAKVDQDEIYAPLRERGLVTTALTMALVVMAAFGVGFVGHRRDTRWLRNQLAVEREHRLILDSTDQGVLGLDTQGRHVFVNPAACRMLGYTPEELIGKPSHAVWHPTKACGRPCPPQECPVCAAVRGGTSSRSDDDLFWKKDGTSFAAEYTATPSLEKDRPVALVLFFRDITQRKQLELQQAQYAVAVERQRQAMQELYSTAEVANRAKSEFLANMSHELRTPMTAILGYVDLLTGQLDHPEHREALNIIRRNGDHLLTVINDILDLSKIEAGKMQVEHRPCSPAAVVADVVSLMRVRADGKGLALKLEFAGPVPATVSTDPARLRQILLNLVGNAIKFTEIGGKRIVVRLLDGETPQAKLVWEVIDTGIGITAEQIQHLFQPFRQADASTSRKFGGTGLGLAISKRLAEFLGGDIAVASDFGKGSTFSLTIDPGPLAGVVLLDHPSEALAAPAAMVAGEAPQPRLNCRILLAEDGVDNQRFISFLLRKAGAEVTTVENGKKAVEMALATFPGWGRRTNDPHEPFHVVLMDMQMPVMDGYEATRRLRQEGYAGPIIALTAHAMAEDRQKCLDAGCDDYATKPIDCATLFNTIAGTLQRHRESRPAAPQPGLLNTSGESS